LSIHLERGESSKYPLQVEFIFRPRCIAAQSTQCGVLDAALEDEENDMEKIFILVLALSVSLGATAMLANGRHATRPGQTLNMKLSADGAFCDGLYIGKLAAKRGQPQTPPVGRWSNERDRASFVDGYRRGYSAVLASVKQGEFLQ
jgi:hypothetical protein